MKTVVPSKIVLVVKNNESTGRCNVPQGYLVIPNNDKQLASAREWGYCYEQDKLGNTRKVEPFEYYLDNKDFKVTIVEEAGSSSQGGKLSFWNCLVEQGEVKAKIGIDQTSLLELIKGSTIVNGQITAGCSLFKSSTAGAIHPGMDNWGGYEDGENKAKKTTKYKLGHIYESKTQSGVYLGEIWVWGTINASWESGIGRVSKIDILDKPISRHIVLELGFNGLDSKVTNGEIKSVGDIYKDSIELANTKRMDINNLSYLSILGSYWCGEYDKLPARYESDTTIEADNAADELTSYIKYFRDKALQNNKEELDNDEILNFILTTAKGNELELSESDIEKILAKVTVNTTITFNGKDYIGKIKT